MHTFTIYFDGACPLCLMEIQELRRLNKDGSLLFVDVNLPDFAENYPHIDKQSALARLHGESGDGQMLYGLDVTVAAWSAVGKHRWLKVLRWPIVSIFADAGYRFFARYRAQIAWLLTGRCHIDCSDGSCVANDDSNIGSSP